MKWTRFTYRLIPVVPVVAMVTGFAMAAGSEPLPNRSNTDALGGAERLVGTADHAARGASASSGAMGPGLTVGTTNWDLQHNGSTGRQLDHYNGRIAVSYTDGELNGDRRVCINRDVMVMGSPQPGAGGCASVLPLAVAGPTNCLPDLDAGFTNLRMLAGGRSAIVHHLANADESLAWVELFPGGYGYCGSLPDYVWPKLTTSLVGTDTVLHVVSTEINSATPMRDVIYWRGRRVAGSCVWTTRFMGAVTTISPVVETRGSQVVIAYLSPRTTTSEQDNDVVYQVSTDAGITWIGPINVTNYTTAVNKRAYTDLDAVFDGDGVLHLIWNTLKHNSDGTWSARPTKLYHWSPLTGTTMITGASWTNDCTQLTNEGAGLRNLLMAKPSLSVKPAGMGPGGGIPDQLLYAVWVQFGPTSTDCSDKATGGPGGFVNGELYWSVSSDGGASWDRPQNFTCTETPGCVPGTCLSEHWVTTAALADSAVYCSYVEDTHPGAAPVPEGAVTESPYKVVALAARAPVLGPCIWIEPLAIEGCVGTAGIDRQSLIVYNTCNATLTFTVTVMPDNNGQAHIMVNGGSSYSGTILAGGAPEFVEVSYEGLGLPDPTCVDWRLEVTSNDPTNDPNVGGTPIDVPVSIIVTDEPVCDPSLCCPIVLTGDVNNDGTITSSDIIYLVNHVFKGGPDPLPCRAAGDTNCNGAVTSADIILLVNFVFKGGPPPCDVCTLFPTVWQCP